MTFWRDECEAKVVYTIKLGVLNILTPVRIIPYIHAQGAS